HVAVHQLYGSRVSPHGAEWTRLVEAAGHAARIRTSDDANGTRSPGRTAKVKRGITSVRYEHRCPVCQSMRFARRPVTAWRCAECRDAGLDGAMVITRLEARSGT
ncbi:MAG: hypothetical protein ACREL7_16935, partial [Longimicrobiales bacterium]